jgi:chromosome segregation ATPase
MQSGGMQSGGMQSGALEEMPAYEWSAWPHTDRRELEIACRRLEEAKDRTQERIELISERTQWAQRLEQEVRSAARTIQELQEAVDERTVWARRLDLEIEASARRNAELQGEMEERTAWAQRLDRECDELRRQLSERNIREEQLDRDLASRAAHIRRLDRELEERTLAHNRDLDRFAWAAPLDRRFHALLDSAFRLVHRVFARVRQTLGGRSRNPDQLTSHK